MGRFVNRPYRNYSLFISEAASLFNIHSSHVSSRLPFPATQFHTFIAANSPPCLKGGRGDSVSPSRQHCADGDVCGRSQNAPTGCKDRIVLK